MAGHGGDDSRKEGVEGEEGKEGGGGGGGVAEGRLWKGGKRSFSPTSENKRNTGLNKQWGGRGFTRICWGNGERETGEGGRRWGDREGFLLVVGGYCWEDWRKEKK